MELKKKKKTIKTKYIDIKRLMNKSEIINK